MELGLKGKTVAILAAEGVATSDLAMPRQALEAAGATVRLVASSSGELRVAEGDAPPATADGSFDDLAAADVAAAYIPGGRGAESLRADRRAVQLVRELMLADKPVAAVGEGIALLIAADAVAGRTVAAPDALRTAVTEAGGTVVAGAMHVDGRLLTARERDDLGSFAHRMVREFGNRLDETRVDELSEASFPASDPPPGPASVGGSGASRTADGDARP